MITVSIVLGLIVLPECALLLASWTHEGNLAILTEIVCKHTVCSVQMFHHLSSACKFSQEPSTMQITLLKEISRQSQCLWVPAFASAKWSRTSGFATRKLWPTQNCLSLFVGLLELSQNWIVNTSFFAVRSDFLERWTFPETLVEWFALICPLTNILNV